MTAREQLKKRLKNYRTIKDEYQQVKKERDWVLQNMDSLRASNLDGMPRGSGVSDPVAQAFAKLEALLNRYTEQLERLGAEQAAIEDMIAGLESVERRLMRHKYFEGLTWEEVCVAINYSWTRTHEIHGLILDKLLDKFGEEERSDD